MTPLFIGLIAGLVTAAAILASRSFFRVAEGHRGVLSAFGRAQRQTDGKLVVHGPGLHLKAPWQRVHDVKIMEQRLELSGAGRGTTVLARDGTVLRFDSILRFCVDEDGIDQWIFNIEKPEDHVVGLFTSLLRNEIATFGPDPHGEDAEKAIEGSFAHMRRERRLLSQRVQRFCEDVGKETGIHFTGVDLVDVLPPDELRDALNAVAHARAEAEASYARAQAECARRVMSAAHGVLIAEQRAKAAEIEITELAGFLNELDKGGTLESYVARRRAEVLSQSKTLFLGSHA
jgi:regulator of protease activity HflC (stomatin/prohibitin superfamily)